jgi:hypothetical protein
MPFSEGIIISGLEKFNGRATMEFDILVWLQSLRGDVLEIATHNELRKYILFKDIFKVLVPPCENFLWNFVSK